VIWRIAFVLLAALVAGCSQTPTPISTSTPDPGASGPAVEDSAENVQFRLSVRLESDIHRAGVPIDVETQLTYLGPGGSVVVGSDWSPPVYFELQHLTGDLDMTGAVSNLMCEQTPMDAGVGLSIPFGKGGGWSADDPRAGYWQAFYTDPELRLPAGNWRILAQFQGTTNDRCEGPPQKLTAGVEFTVLP
jgi:hypothetical protein